VPTTSRTKQSAVILMIALLATACSNAEEPTASRHPGAHADPSNDYSNFGSGAPIRLCGRKLGIAINGPSLEDISGSRRVLVEWKAKGGSTALRTSASCARGSRVVYTPQRCVHVLHEVQGGTNKGVVGSLVQQFCTFRVRLNGRWVAKFKVRS